MNLNKYNLNLTKKSMINAIENIQANNSKSGVVACIWAENKKKELAYFTGVNLEFSRNNMYHAEEVAYIEAMNYGYIYPLRIYIYALKKKQQVPMCLKCRDIFSRINPDLNVIVFDKKFNVMLEKTIRELEPFLYKGTHFIK